jgi:hypothetical protein
MDWAHILAYITATVNEELVHGEFLNYASISSRNNRRETQKRTLHCLAIVWLVTWRNESLSYPIKGTKFVPLGKVKCPTFNNLSANRATRCGTNTDVRGEFLIESLL